MKIVFTACAVMLACVFTTASYADVYTGNGNTGFGGGIGNGSLELTSDGTNVAGTFTKGAGGFDNTLVLYLDTTAGGFTDTSTFSDQSDTLRKAISGLNGSNRSTVNFAAGFGADFAIALSPTEASFGGLWALASGGDNSLPYVDAVALSPNNNAGPHTFSFALSDLGLSAGDSFDFVGTYLNGTNAFRADEAIGAGIASGNPGNPSSITFSNSESFAVAVPEPASLALLLGGCLIGIARRHRS